MQTKRQIFLVLLILVVVCGCHMAVVAAAQQPRPRIRIADLRPQTGAVDLQNGYNQYNTARQDFMYGYGKVPLPQAIPAISSTVYAHIPLLREPSSSTAAPIAGIIQESVVYGNWKPVPPLKPEEFEQQHVRPQHLSKPQEFDQQHVRPQHPFKPEELDQQTTVIPQPKQRVYGRLEAMLMGMSSDVVARQPTSQEEDAMFSSEQHAYDSQNSFEQSSQEQQYGRWREPAISPGPTVSSPTIVHMNSSNPLLKATATQMNESIETTTASRSRTTDDNWVPLPMPYPPETYETTQPASASKPPATAATLPKSSLMLPSATFVTSTPTPSDATESTSVSLNWPADFVDTSTREPIDIDRRDDNVEDYKYYEDTLNSAQMHSELSIPETVVPHLPKLPLNITRMGVPYEQQNAANEPTICVPLTMAETSIASDSVAPTTIELERIYCFPLPNVDINAGNVSNVLITQVRQPTIEATSPKSTLNVLDTEQPKLVAAATVRNSLDLTLALLSCIIIWCSALARD